MRLLLVLALARIIGQGIALLVVDGVDVFSALSDRIHTFYVDHFCETMTEEEYNRMWEEYRQN